MKINLTYDLDSIDDKETLFNLIYADQMSGNIFEVLNLMRSRRKHGTKTGPISEDEASFITDVMELLNTPNIGW